MSGPQPHVRRKVKNILTERELLMSELVALRRRGEASQFSENALELLTRWWSAKSWAAREKLLRSASWLVRLEQRRGDPLSATLLDRSAPQQGVSGAA